MPGLMTGRWKAKQELTQREADWRANTGLWPQRNMGKQPTMLPTYWMHSDAWDTSGLRQPEPRVGMSAQKKARRSTKLRCVASPWTAGDYIVLRASLERAPRRKRTMGSKREWKTPSPVGESSSIEQKPVLG